MNISIVDDDDDVRGATESLLRSLGFATKTFRSAEDFLLSHDADATDCVVTDVQMPGMSGVEMQYAMRASGDRTPLIFITAFPDESVRRQALEGGASGFFSKPFDGDAMLECLNSVNAGRRTG